MVCTQWIWIVQLYYDDRIIGYYADEYTAERAVKIHSLTTSWANPEDYNIFKVPVMKDSVWQNMHITA